MKGTMITDNKVKNGYYGGLVVIISSAVVASSAVFLLFDAFLERLVPPYEDSNQAVAFASFGTAIAHLVLSLALQKRLRAATTRAICVLCGVLLVMSILLFGYFRDTTRTYVYRIPPSSQPADSQTLHIRGNLHEIGRQRVGNMTVARAVFDLGGPDFVNSKGLLWSEESRLARIGQIERQYVVLAMLLTTTLFTAAIAVWRRRATFRP